MQSVMYHHQAARLCMLVKTYLITYCQQMKTANSKYMQLNMPNMSHIISVRHYVIATGKEKHIVLLIALTSCFFPDTVCSYIMEVMMNMRVSNHFDLHNEAM